ncbi:hypothetical protein U5922_008665 [Aquicoccus sp. G2-2]|uniref:hypothetical protein n=1 Tax=Aquicoccus sp. G2-2 TaxID=3092120 RepID=UPI002AE036B3|nr:hypothetical protein [Aquicoccus sp. G2-2]MEA1113542.1 hypothetical protein [Aquicoccus sp. G2-2]
MANFDYETNAAKHGTSPRRGSLGLLVVVAIVLAVLVLFGFMGGGTATNGSGEAGAVPEQPTSTAPAVDSSAPAQPAAD